MANNKAITRVTLFLGPNEDDNSRVYDSIRRFSHIQVEVISGATRLLADYLPMPYIQVDNGMRYFGQKGIDVYLAGETKV